MADSSISLFGWRLIRDDEKQEKLQTQQTPISPSFEDGSINIQTGAHYGIYVDMDGSYRSELDLLTKYRTMSMQPEMENAIDDIVNEAIVHDEDEMVVKLNLDNLDQPDNIKKMIREEFDEVLRLMDFRRFASDIFRRWYVDGRLYYNVVIDNENPRDGIQQLIYIDPRRIRKIRNITKEKNEQGVEIITKIDVFYLYNEKIVNNNTQSPQLVGNFAGGIKLSEDSVVQITSGLFDPSKSTVLSFLHKAIRPMNQLRFIEDATVVYRVSRAPERRVFYVDVGNMPKAKAEQYLKDIMTKYRNKLTYDATTGEVRDATKHLCLDMSTKVPLLDGRTLTLTEIERELAQGKALWAYSCDPLTGKFEPGRITWAGVARKDAKVMKLTLDNGETITCTPDHKFPVWDKGMTPAENLKVGDSMIALYRKKELIDSRLKDENKDYEMLYLHDQKKWAYTHRVVSKWKDDAGIENQFTFDQQYADLPHNTIHHRNINRFDNSPDNLVRMHSKDHIHYHQSAGSGSGKIGGTNCHKMGKGWHNKNHPDYIKWHSDGGKTITPARVTAAQANYAKGREKFQLLMQDPVYAAEFAAGQVENWTSENRAAQSQRAKVRNLSKLGNDARWAKVRVEKQARLNHKIAAIEYLDETMDTGCLTIDNAYHTFALDAGIYTQNSMLEDFWMPRRGDANKSTEITTLPAGQNLGQMEDVLYFEKKLYRALGVPVSRLEPSQGFSLGRSSEITRDEIKFDKFIQKLRAHFSMLFDELLARQLTLKGICNLDDWKGFREDIRYIFTKDNNFAELKDAELTANRLNLLGMIEPFVGRYYSKRWVQEKLLRFTESEIEEMKEQIEDEAEEMAKEAEATMAAQPGVAGQPGTSPTEGGPTPLNAEQDKDEVNNRFVQQMTGNQ